MDNVHYYVRDRSLVQGPFNLQELERRVRTRRFSRHHQVSVDKVEWRRAAEAIPELFQVGPSVPPPLEIGLDFVPDTGGSFEINELLPPVITTQSGQSNGVIKNSGLATTSLILGILSIFLSCLTGIPALVCGLLGLRQIRQSEQAGRSRLSGRGLATAGIALSIGFMVSHLVVIPALLLPAVQAAREAARRSSCSNNLKCLLLGMHNYVDTNDFLPTDIRDADGTPLLSWRVAILPYLEEGQLYKKFRLTEPWDSPHNIQLLGEMPGYFSCPSHAEENTAGMTSYIAVNGVGFFLDPNGKPRSFRDISDGTSKSIAIVEVPPSLEQEWTKPDPQMGEVNLLDATSNCHSGGLFGVGFVDGHVEFLQAGEFDRSLFRSLLTIGGGEPIPEY